MSKVNTPVAAAEHGEWLKALDRHKEEIHDMERRLADVAARNSAFEARQGIEHFQNQFVVQRNNIDELRHRVHEHDDRVKKHEGQPQWSHEETRDGAHGAIRSEFEAFKKVLKELREEFNQFTAKWV
jgi:arginine deiminase